MFQRIWRVFCVLVTMFLLMTMYMGATIGLMWFIVNMEQIWDGFAGH